MQEGSVAARVAVLGIWGLLKGLGCLVYFMLGKFYVLLVG